VARSVPPGIICSWLAAALARSSLPASVHSTAQLLLGLLSTQECTTPSRPNQTVVQSRVRTWECPTPAEGLMVSPRQTSVQWQFGSKHHQRVRSCAQTQTPASHKPHPHSHRTWDNPQPLAGMEPVNTDTHTPHASTPRSTVFHPLHQPYCRCCSILTGWMGAAPARYHRSS